MSILKGKKVLVVGEKSSAVHKLDAALVDYGVDLINISCDAVTTDKILLQSVDLVLLDHLHDSKTCKDTLDSLCSSDLGTVVPVLALVDNNSAGAQEAISYGATDYFTKLETEEFLIKKIESIIGDTEEFSDNAVIDLSPTKANVSTKGIRVFVVEDDPLLQNLLSIKLEKSSFPFEFTSNGEDVINTINLFGPDVIILDLMLPGKSGLEILAELKADNKLKDVPVIVFSNRDGQDERSAAKKLGAVAFYVKAMTDLSELVETIEAHAKK